MSERIDKQIVCLQMQLKNLKNAAKRTKKLFVYPDSFSDTPS